MAGRPRASAPLVITPGDPRGIGPEVTACALAALGGALGEVLVLGDVPALAAAGLRASGTVDVRAPRAPAPRVEWAALDEAAALCLSGDARAMVTGPIHKARLAAAGFRFHGHTDYLGHLAGVAEPVMAFVGGAFRVALVTVHVPLAAVPALVTRERVVHVLRTAHAALVNQLGVTSPRLLACGLNPHAGEGGLLGDEERVAIGPAVAEARALGIDARGPVSAEEAFMFPDACDLVVAMYHDQGLVPLKRADFGRTVNWTMGLPFVRTSVDHGTADALVGTGRARAGSMIEAIRLADKLSRR